MNLTHCHSLAEQAATCISMWFCMAEGAFHTFALTCNSLPLCTYTSLMYSSSPQIGYGQGLLYLIKSERFLNAMNHEKGHFGVFMTRLL